MNILFIFPNFPEDISSSSLVKDLTDHFVSKDHNVFIATLRERKNRKGTELKFYDGFQVLRVEVGNLFNDVNRVEKMVSSMIMPVTVLRAIKDYWGDQQIDLIVTQTPYTSSGYLINGLKKHFNAEAFLILFDIFPQNAKDIGLINNELLFKFFKHKELEMLKSFDHIGCMSQGNVDYMRTHYPFMRDKNLIQFYLWGKPPFSPQDFDRDLFRLEYGIKPDDFVLIFGGNIGRPQRMENIINLAKSCRDDQKIRFIIIGQGTEAKRMKEMVTQQKLEQVLMIDFVPREKYIHFVAASDVGIVTLDQRFTVPNFPSKSIDYIRLGLPVLASLDDASARDFGVLIRDELKCGLFSKAGDVDALKENLYRLKDDADLRVQMGQNGVAQFEKYFDVSNMYGNIINVIDQK